jgi:hypothetical protein
VTRHASLSILLVSSLIREVRSFTKDGTSEAVCLYLTKKPAVVMETEILCCSLVPCMNVYTQLLSQQFFIILCRSLVEVLFLRPAHLTGFSWLLSIHFDILWNTISDYPTISSFHIIPNLLFAVHTSSC